MWTNNIISMIYHSNITPSTKTLMNIISPSLHSQLMSWYLTTGWFYKTNCISLSCKVKPLIYPKSYRSSASTTNTPPLLVIKSQTIFSHTQTNPNPNPKPMRSPSNSMRIQTQLPKNYSEILSKVESNARMGNCHPCSNFSSKTPTKIDIINPPKRRRSSQRRRNPHDKLCYSLRGKF